MCPVLPLIVQDFFVTLLCYISFCILYAPPIKKLLLGSPVVYPNHLQRYKKNRYEPKYFTANYEFHTIFSNFARE